MKAGRVVRIRVNPADCMGCVDIIRQLGVNTQGMSFSQVVSLGLRSALQTLRDNKVIPQRDGFEFATMMEPFRDNPSVDRLRKLDITEAIDKLSTVPGMNGVAESDEPKATEEEVERYRELRELAKSNPGGMTVDQIEEYSKLAVRVGEL